MLIPNMRYNKLLILVMLYALPVAGCSAQKKTKMDHTPDKFSQVPLNTRMQTDCSPPEQLPTWRGLILQAPEHVVLRPGDEKNAIPVCGYYQLDMAKLQKAGPLTLVVVQKGKEKSEDAVYRGAMVDEDPSPEVPPPDDRGLKPADMAGMASGSYFNPDLLHYVRMPATPGRYEVYAEYAGARSNTVSITLDYKDR